MDERTAYRGDTVGPGRRPGTLSHPVLRVLEPASILVASAIVAGGYLRLCLTVQPHSASPPQGWWNWFDQGKYLTAAVAWASGDLSPARHYYLPGYPLLGTPFVRLTPANPFLIPNLLCLLATLWLFCAVGARLARPIPWPRAFSAAAFLVSLGVAQALASWVIPWSTTASTPLILGCLLAVLRMQEFPRRFGAAFLAGTCGAALVAVRPADAAVVLLCAGTAIVHCLWSAELDWRCRLRVAGAALAGSLVPAALLTASHLAIFGWQIGDYLTSSHKLGFEWRLLPVNWVTIILDPRPIFTTGRGLSEVFPWVIPGLVGIAVCVGAPSRNEHRRAHILVGGTACAYCSLYLTYRGLNSDWLWRYNLYHYFQWILPVLALYAGLLAYRLLMQPSGRGRSWAAAIVAVSLILPWRAELTIARPFEIHLGSATQGEAIVRIPSGIANFADAILIPGEGSDADVFLAAHEARIGGKEFENRFGFQVYRRDRWLMIAPLRSLPRGELSLSFAPGIRLHAGVPALFAHQRIVFGLPCWFGIAGDRCRTPATEPLFLSAP